MPAPVTTDLLEPYDALLLVSFGGPEGPDDVLPFLNNVTRGRGIPPERLAEVAEHYHAVGGRSPINDQCRDFLDAVRTDLGDAGLEIGVYWGNRNWDPYLTDTLRQMSHDGVRRAAAFVTSAYASYSGCRQYRENLYDAAEMLGSAPRIDKLRHYYNHPGFVEAMADSTRQALGDIGAADQEVVRLLFVTHSIPTAMANSSGPNGGAYVDQHRCVADLVTREVARVTGSRLDWDLVYCSRSGSPQTPWLEPDVNDHLTALVNCGTTAVVVVPIGFVSDHMEVVFDLDTEAAQTAADLGLRFARAATAGVHPSFVAGVRDLLLERACVERGEPFHRATVGETVAAWDLCGKDCCPNPRGGRPALSQAPLATWA